MTVHSFCYNSDKFFTR